MSWEWISRQGRHRIVCHLGAENEQRNPRSLTPWGTRESLCWIPAEKFNSCFNSSDFTEWVEDRSIKLLLFFGLRRGQGIPILYYTGSANLRLKWTRASKYAKLELVPKFREKQPDLPLAKFHAEWKSGCKSVCVIISRNFRGYFDLVILRFCGGFRCRLAHPGRGGKFFADTHSVHQLPE